ncbi:MAG: cyclophilin-like fold protein [Candidatus Aenigmatarchaeota archaeon]
MKIKIEIGDEVLKGELIESMNPETFAALVEELPLEGKAQKWGKELYFRVPVNVELENEKRYVKKGEIGYWPEGNALCFFYGKTPGSPSENKIKPATAVNVVGSFENPEKLEKFDGGVEVEIKED